MTRRAPMTEHPESHAAGEDLSDQEMMKQVAKQTSSELKHKAFFEREANGTTTDTEAAKADADQISSE
jgi:hypothetical protein